MDRGDEVVLMLKDRVSTEPTPHHERESCQIVQNKDTALHLVHPVCVVYLVGLVEATRS